MGSVVVLGGAGGVGRVAVEALLHIDDTDEVVVTDVRADAAAAVVEELADGRLRPAAVDVTDTDAVVALLRGADVVLSCVGPFYRFGPPALEAAIRAGVRYVDVCDDLDATRALLALDGAARDAGVQALIGMGNSPGIANVFVKLCAEQLLDTVTSADIMHIHGGEPTEGAAVLKHRVHAMVGDVPLFVDGRFVDVRMLEPSGEAFVRTEDFPGLGPYPVFPYPHPETITLPATFPSLRRATNLGVVFPLSYFTLTQDLVRAGLGSEEPLRVGASSVAPIDVLVAVLQRDRPRLLAEAGVTGRAGCLRVEVGGEKDGAAHTYVCTLSSTGAGAGEGTGIPAAIGAALHRRGALDGGPGVHPPEAVVPVDAFLALATDVIGRMGVETGGSTPAGGDDGTGAGGDGASPLPLTLEHIGPDGSREVVAGIG